MYLLLYELVIPMAADIKNAGLSKDFVNAVVSRTIKSRIEEINQKLTDLCKSTKYFEKKYGMKTEEFYKKFLRGHLGTIWIFSSGKHHARCIRNYKKREKRSLRLLDDRGLFSNF